MLGKRFGLDELGLRLSDVYDMGFIISNLETGGTSGESAKHALASFGTVSVQGTHNVKVNVEGHTATGKAFARVGLRSIVVS